MAVIESCAGVRDEGDFARRSLVYTPTLSLPLETRGRERDLTRTFFTFALSQLIGRNRIDDRMIHGDDPVGI